MPRFDYDVFFSFASLNEAMARPLYEKLTESGLRVFWSDVSLKEGGGKGWYKQIERALDSSRHLVLLWTPEAKASNFVELEYTSFHAETIQEEDRLLIPVLTKGNGTQTLPRFLRQLQSYSLTKDLKQIVTSLGGRYEPLAVENARLREELAEARDEIKFLRQTAGATAKAKKQKIQAELDSLKKQYTDLENRSSQDSRDWAKNRKSLLIEIASKDAEISDIKQQVASLQAQLKTKADRGKGPRPSAKAPPETMKDGYGFEFILIKPGTFMMGSDYGDDREKPVHKVEITKPFYLGKYPVTQWQWEVIEEKNPSRFNGESLPVERVSWNAVQKYLKKLQKGEAVYRLPTEAEWEYACRAGTSTEFSFGDDEGEVGAYAWYAENADSRTHPVGRKKPNPWGIYDMHGNVYEWVEDWFDEDYYGLLQNKTTKDPRGPSSGSRRVIRGGGWSSNATNLRTACRFNRPQTNISNHVGFRLVKTIP